MPLSVVVALIRHAGQLLLVRRARGHYAGWWALPGGKIETSEHVSDAARREVREETGLDATFDAHLGIVSEHLYAGDDAAPDHFLLHVCALSAGTASVTPSDEGALRWIDARDVASVRRLLPSDRAMIEHFLLTDAQADPAAAGYCECAVERDGDAYRLRAFG